MAGQCQNFELPGIAEAPARGFIMRYWLFLGLGQDLVAGCCLAYQKRNLSARQEIQPSLLQGQHSGFPSLFSHEFSTGLGISP
jgi:hypothetical protein